MSFLGKGQVTAHNRLPPIRPSSRREAVPLCVAQESFWELEQQVPGNAFSNLTSVVRVRGPLNVAVLRRAFDEVIRRQEALRTTFATVGGTTVQVVNPPWPLEIARVDLRELSEAHRQDAFLMLGIKEFSLPFDLRNGPLLRVALFQTADEEHMLVETIHHIVSDSWSLKLLNREVAILYAAYAEGHASPLPPLTVQYGDFVLWEQHLLQGPHLDSQRAYWKGKLCGSDRVQLALPSDHPRPSHQSFKTASRTFALSGALSRALRELGHSEGCTLFMTLLSTFAIVLKRFAGQDEVRLGTVVTRRAQRQLEDLIGLFLNTLVLRLNLANDPTLYEVLARTQHVLLEAYEHQDLPFDSLITELHRTGGFRRAGLFPVLFLFEHAPETPLTVANLHLDIVNVKEMVQTEVTVTGFDMIVTLYEKEEGVRGVLIYKTTLFLDETIERLLDDFVHIAQEVVAHPHQHMSALPPLPAWDKL